ncbi:MAG: BACON domain-containing protein, partial [Tidjanibacter sp.]|nr:BACON domain-containing protein [Tidjanibacter sp.]
MKKFPFISMFMALFTFAIACTPEPVEMTLSVTPAQLEYTAEGGVQSVTVSASHATWSAVSGAEWCDVNLPGKIENNESVAFAVEPNTGEERTTTVTFTLGEKSATVTIRQLAAEVNPLDALGSLYEVPAEGAEIRIAMEDTEDVHFDY